MAVRTLHAVSKDWRDSSLRPRRHSTLGTGALSRILPSGRHRSVRNAPTGAHKGSGPSCLVCRPRRRRAIQSSTFPVGTRSVWSTRSTSVPSMPVALAPLCHHSAEAPSLAAREVVSPARLCGIRNLMQPLSFRDTVMDASGASPAKGPHEMPRAPADQSRVLSGPTPRSSIPLGDDVVAVWRIRHRHHVVAHR
jgi:hypothetical protein